MADNSSRQPVARILYREITEGDLRKVLAKSNDSDTGGGARDLRFGFVSGACSGDQADVSRDG